MKHKFKPGDLVLGPFIIPNRPLDPEWTHVRTDKRIANYSGEDYYHLGLGRVTGMTTNNHGKEFVDIEILEGHRISGGYNAKDLIHFDLCPVCDTEPKASPDYLCEKCRWGC